MQRWIVREINKYASEVIDEKDRKTRGSFDWCPQRLEEFSAYIVICLLMGLKRFPLHRLYWSRDESLFNYLIILRLITRDLYELITRYLHVANAPPDVQDHSSFTFDKLHKIQWMVDEVRAWFKAMWSPNQ